MIKSATTIILFRNDVKLKYCTSSFCLGITLAAQNQTTVSVVVGGYEELIDPMDLTATIEITPRAEEQVSIARGGRVNMAEGMLVLQIQNEGLVRGGEGKVKVWFTLENSGDETIEIVTAENSGQSDSDQIRFTLLDNDQNILALSPLRQAVGEAVGEAVVTLSDKTSVARIGAGEMFTAASLEFPVPATAPDDLTVQLSISEIYYHKGQETQVRMNGLTTTHNVTLTDTAYYGRVDTIDPQVSAGDQEITITGQAVERTTETPMANVPLNLIVSHKGFERSFEIYTDGGGQFTHIYPPTGGESGEFAVRAMHPDLTDKPVHGEFTISRVAVTPTEITLTIPRNYEQSVPLTLTAGRGTRVN